MRAWVGSRSGERPTDEERSVHVTVAAPPPPSLSIWNWNESSSAAGIHSLERCSGL